jgi:hypothetical protein
MSILFSLRDKGVENASIPAFWDVAGMSEGSAPGPQSGGDGLRIFRDYEADQDI